MALLLGRKKETVLLEIPVGEIYPNPMQPRKYFDPEGVRKLAESIRKYGVLQPLTVRKREGGYELIAGERRLRAAREAGLWKVPCVLYSMNGEDSAILAVIENLQREDLNLFEQAEAMEKLIGEYKLTQEEVAEKLSLSQSSVANKLRILKLEDRVKQVILEQGLTERHARALLRVKEEEKRWEFAKTAGEKGWTVQKTEEQIEHYLQHTLPKRQIRVKGAFRDVRLFSNTLDRALTLLRRSGVKMEEEKTETETEVIFTVRIQKASGN